MRSWNQKRDLCGVGMHVLADGNNRIEASCPMCSLSFSAASLLPESVLYGKPVLEPREKRVFISGSRWQKEIPDIVLESLRKICAQKIEVLIGDCPQGVDAEVIRILWTEMHYPCVRVYTVQDHPRIPVCPDWTVVHVNASSEGTGGSSLRPRERQTLKDRQMAMEATWGLAICNPLRLNRFGRLEVSAGTLRNVIQMLLSGQPVKFFCRMEGEMRAHPLYSIDELEQVLRRSQQERCTGDPELDSYSPAERSRILLTRFDALCRQEEQERQNRRMQTLC